MRLLVSRQVGALSEALVTASESALVGFLTCVGANVGSEVEVKAELLVADVALELLLSSVHELVSLQLRVVQELLPTALHLADKLCERSYLPLAVSQQMLSPRGVVCEKLRTVRVGALELV